MPIIGKVELNRHIGALLARIRHLLVRKREAHTTYPMMRPGPFKLLSPAAAHIEQGLAGTKREHLTIALELG